MNKLVREIVLLFEITSDIVYEYTCRSHNVLVFVHAKLEVIVQFNEILNKRDD